MGESFDRELVEHPPELRWRIWMGRVEAVIFASGQPTPREKLALVVGEACDLDALLAEISRDLATRPYELVEVAGGWQHRTRPEYAPMLRICGVVGPLLPDLSQKDLTILMAIAYFQPITRADLSLILGKQISRDAISALSRRGFVAAGPRSPKPGAPYTYVTTTKFLADYGFKSLSELPDMEKLAEAGLLNRKGLEEVDDLERRLEIFGDEDTEGWVNDEEADPRDL